MKPYLPRTTSHKWKYGFLMRWESGWVGFHYSPYHKRLCVNLLPFCTVWITAPGGDEPQPGYCDIRKKQPIYR